jgi:hypothetical protein
VIGTQASQNQARLTLEPLLVCILRQLEKLLNKD